MIDKRQFLEQIIDSIRNIDISHIMKKYITLVKRGNNYLAICPFHNDRNLGSFVVSSDKGIFKCFSCGVGGDIIKFVSLIKNINYVEAAFEIALHETLITNEEYEEYFKKRRYFKKEVKIIEKIYIEKDKEKFKSNIADIGIRNEVFNIFLNTLKLKPEHEKYLKDERDLSDKIIKNRKYRSCQLPTKGFMERFEYNLKEKNFSLDILKDIPGFFQRQIKEKWQWTFMYDKGIFIPIRNSNGKIAGLQMRKDKENENGIRYFWFSSTFAEYSDKFQYGTSSGSPLDVVYPNKVKNAILFITEGRFKAEIIAKKFNSICISIQGVNNWNRIVKEIKEIQKKIGLKFTHIYIAFDSDLTYKYQIYEQLQKMSNYIKSNIQLQNSSNHRKSGIYYICWDANYKGIDDLLFSDKYKNIKNYKTLFVVHEKEYWDNEYKKQLEKILKEKGKKCPRDLSQNDLIVGINIGERKIAT